MDSACFVIRAHVMAGAHVLTKDSTVTGAQLCQYSSCIPWQCLFGCNNGRRSAIKQF